MKITKKQLKRLIRESIGIPHSLQVLEDKEDRIMSFINGQLLSSMGASDDINVSIEDLLSLRNDIDSIREKEGMPAKDYSRPYLYAAENAIKQHSRHIKEIKEELDIEDQRAMDMGIIPYPDGTYASDPGLLDLDDYESLENTITSAMNNFIEMGYEKEDVVEALKSIIEDV